LKKSKFEEVKVWRSRRTEEVEELKKSKIEVWRLNPSLRLK
jgi:hypothetical protein